MFKTQKRVKVVFHAPGSLRLTFACESSTPSSPADLATTRVNAAEDHAIAIATETTLGATTASTFPLTRSSPTIIVTLGFSFWLWIGSHHRILVILDVGAVQRVLSALVAAVQRRQRVRHFGGLDI